jgi:hypothetical protein
MFGYPVTTRVQSHSELTSRWYCLPVSVGYTLVVSLPDIPVVFAIDSSSAVRLLAAPSVMSAMKLPAKPNDWQFQVYFTVTGLVETVNGALFLIPLPLNEMIARDGGGLEGGGALVGGGVGVGVLTGTGEDLTGAGDDEPGPA